MAHYSLHQRVRLTADLLLGMRLLPVQKLLEPRGFSEETLRHGWGLLEAVGLVRISGNPGLVDDKMVALIEFRKQWAPVVRAVLRRTHPKVLEFLLSRYRIKAKSQEAVLARGFVENLRALETKAKPGDQEALAQLRARGLTEDVLLEGESRVRAYLDVTFPSPSVSAREVEEQAAFELWNFYLEWSSHCRHVVTNGTWLRALGLSPERRGRRAPFDSAARPQLAAMKLAGRLPGPASNGSRE